ncbi:hypothetical protein BHE90_000345 [Fusarium euwallaceae]|nr:hypothetical protein BHE90_000345 [Fusarium euwallaceae]
MPERPNISGPSPQSGDQWEFGNPSMGEQGGGDLMSFMGDLCELPQAYNLLHLPLDSEPTPSSGPHQRESCACVFALTQMMDRIRQDQDLPFPSNLGLLREALRSAAIAIDCQVCPRLFVTAMQNGLLLCTAIISVAHGYVRIARQIDNEATRCSEMNQMKVLDVKDSFSQSVETFTLETGPQEWKLLAMKMVRAEVFGVSGGSRPCFASTVTQLERRQKSWHADPPGAFFPDSYRTTDDSPSCLRLLKDARGIVACLDDDPSPSNLG